jgi:protein-S-isoprenylcysteine O-methyltransferase Ste14
VYFLVYFLTYGRVEAKHEKTINMKYGKTGMGKIFGILLSLILLIWIVIIIVYFFVHDSFNWFWKIDLLDNDFIKILAMTIMCVGLILNIFFIITVGKSIKKGVILEDTPQLITTGIYQYIRHPAYLAMILSLVGTFLIIPNIFVLIYLFCAILGIYGHSREEEKSLIKQYGEKYELYKKKAGRFLPKIKRN